MNKLFNPVRSTLEALGRPLRVLQKLGNSRDLATAMIDFALAETREEGNDADDRMLDAMMRRELKRAVEPALKSAKGVARKLLEDPRIVGPLEATHHLGALESLSPLKANRIDYVALTVDLLLQIKLRYPGLGLSSPVSGWQHADRATGLELTQSWAVLHSWGHLFGTFATERALIFTLERDPELEAELKGACQSELRPHVEAVLGSRDLHRVYYALAAWRASTQLGTGRPMLRACAALRLFFEHREQGSRSLLYTAYRRARQLAYHRMHSYLRLGNTCDFAHTPGAVEWILPQPELLFDQTVKAPFVELLDKFDSFQSQQIFTSPLAARLVLDHVRAFKRWWGSRRSQVSASAALAELFQKPTAWSDGGLRPLEHWCRLTLPGSAPRWTSEVREWLEVSNWDQGNFLVSPTPTGTGVAVDVYAATGTSSYPRDAQLLGAVARRLAWHCEAALSNPPPDPEELWRSVAVLTLKSFSWILATGFSASLTPAKAPSPEGRYAIALGSPLRLGDELGRLIPKLSDETRKAELGAVRNALATLDGDGVWLVVVGMVRVVRQATGEYAKELDGIIARVRNDGVQWWFLEQKSGGQGGAAGQLAAMTDVLTVKCTPAETVQVIEGKAAWCSCSWPHIAGGDGPPHRT